VAEKCKNGLAVKTRDDVAKVVIEMVRDQLGAGAAAVGALISAAGGGSCGDIAAQLGLGG